VEDTLFVFALPGSWIFLLFFARLIISFHSRPFRSAKLTGPFVQMIYSMIAGDMIRFAIISAIFLVSFSQGAAQSLSLVPLVSSLLFRREGHGLQAESRSE
jgi:hypothetical protein